MSLDVLLVDDEAPARARLRRLLAAHGDVRVVGEATNGREALEQVQALAPAAVFLDIEMPELGGLEAAAALVGSPPPVPAVVFCTAYDEHAIRAFELSAVDYLLKPVEPARLAATLTRLRALTAPAGVRAAATQPVAGVAAATQPVAGVAAATQPVAGVRASGAAPADAAPPDPLADLVARLGAEARLSRLAVRCGARIVVVDLATVSAVVARDHYAEILCGDRRLLADDALDVLAPRLAAAGFLRLHRGSFANLRFVKELRREGDRKYVAVLDDHFHSELPVSRERLPAVLAALGLSS